ncbi:MAG: alpha-amylase [Betaproteobacteria bacterium]|nr:alpha-amylase [Betaproteobacteria bacterium]
MSFQNKICEQIFNHLNIIYPKSNNTHLTNKIFSIFFEKKSPKQYVIQNRWDESDVALITYLDTFYNNDEKNIQTLEQVLNNYLQDNVSIIHLLPFFPYSSDDGFAVIDYLKIKKGLATWSDIKKLSLKYKIMADLVINHCSSQSEWFQQFLNNQLPGKNYFLDYKDKFDTSKIVRPRSHDLLQIFKTKKSEKFVWCTFSRDQVDLNFKNKDVLIEFLKIIKFYLDQGISILRLDAVAFLWKKLGTNCINLNETHEVIKLFRLLLDASSQKTFLITETNLPNKENLDYFGNGNEAQLIYNFSLPPLILYSMLYGNSTILRKWLMSMPPPMEGTTYFNFIASHDGIGIRPAEGLISEKNIKAILRRMKEFGGEVSYRKVENKNKPYEINIALIDALKGTIDNLDNFQIERFICAHAIMLSLEGIPAIYVHSFFGTENDYSGMQSTKQKRSINRKRYDLKDLRNKMNKKTINSTVLKQLNSLISIRKKQPAFHPNATQFTLNLGEKIFALWRQCQNRKQSIFVLCNITSQKQPVDLNEINLIFNKNWIDLISNKKIESKKISLKPYQTMWISNY